MSIAQRIAEIEEEMNRTQKNKATEDHLGLLKARIAKLRREQVESIMRSGGAKGEGFDVIKSGDARIGLIGFPSVGKRKEYFIKYFNRYIFRSPRKRIHDINLHSWCYSLSWK